MYRTGWKQSSADGTGLAPARSPLLPPAARPLTAALLVACTAVTVLLGAWFRHQTRPGWLDRAVDHQLRVSLGGHRAALELAVRLGDGVWVTGLAAALIAACLVTRRWRGAALVAVAVPAAAALTEFLLKPLVGRTLQALTSYPRYAPGGFRFPSGHATGVFAVAAAFAVLLVNLRRPRIRPAVRVVLAVAAFVAGGAVSAAVTALNLHYFTDSVAGAAVGTGTVLATALILDWLVASRRWQQRFPSRAGRED